jgi:phosphorylase kinase alpha/beta subunit
MNEVLPLSVEQFADDPSELRRTLEDRGALTFEPYSKTEAQWTLSDAPLSTYHGKEYLRTNSRVEHSKQLLFLNRVLSQLVLTEGKLLLPEAFYVEQVPAPSSKPTNQWIPNDHSPLLWAQANLLLALKTFEQTGV